MDRTITLDATDRFTAKDGTRIQAIRLLGDAYRMRKVLAWAALHGFTVRRANRTESPKRAWWLDGQGAYAGWSISCMNRSTTQHNLAGVDVIQDRHYSVFYGPFQICNYFPPQGTTYEDHLHALIDRLLDGRLLADIQGRARQDNRMRSDTRRPSIVLARAA